MLKTKSLSKNRVEHYKKLVENLFKEERSEVQIPFHVQNDGRTFRNTIEFGYSYHRMSTNDFSYTPEPSFLQELGLEIVNAYENDQLEHTLDEPFTNIIVSLYEDGMELEPHIDMHQNHPLQEGFYFDPNVYDVHFIFDPINRKYYDQYYYYCISV
eukprot:TRINITY_DN9259_c2_g1_i3.p1 TRINITY_DN9259_c2_g1~~TRINITY_DN9259_c2_g1_i3.p1  ORF type:complete len:156 (-),score=21.28 TRINITY_DN9259_c2_g1_i3:29-496(-)